MLCVCEIMFVAQRRLGPSKLLKQINQIVHNIVKNRNWLETNLLTIKMRDNLVLSTGLIMAIGPPLRDSKADVSSERIRIHSLRRRANAHERSKRSVRISLRCSIHIINPVDETKLACNTPTDEAPQFL